MKEEERNTAKILTTEMTISNAGLVLANSYIKILFNRLNKILEDSFVNETAQLESIRILQYLALGKENSDDSQIQLNKVLCGVDLASSISNTGELAPEEKVLIDELLETMISHWPAIEESSIESLRGNWLERNGVLVEYEDHWELIIEKKSYDVLLSRSPFSFSIIKLPWMNKPLNVVWPY